MKQISHVFLLFLVTTLLGACASHKPDERVQIHQVYCDSYLHYDMCAEDLNGNGEVDILFFKDTYEVMMYWEPTRHLIPTSRPMHRCAQIMSVDLKQANTETLYVNEETDALTIAHIKTRIFLNYLPYMAGVNRCNGLAEGDDFGTDFPDEF